MTDLHSHFFYFSPDLMCILDFDGYFKSANPAWEKLLGYSEEELIQKHFIDLVYDRDRKKNDEEFSNLSKGVTTLHFENRCKCKNGSIKYIDWALNSNSEKKEIYCIGRESTKNNQKEDEFFQLRKAIDDSFFGVAIATLDGFNTYVNNAALRLFGYDPNIDSMKGTPIEIAYAEPEKATKAMKELVANGHWTGELLAKSKNGTCFDCQVSATVIKNQDGEPMHVLANFLDITEVKKLRLQLEESQKNYKNLFDNALVALFRTELSDGKIINANKAAAKLFGYSSIPELKKNFKSLNHYANPEDREAIIDRIKNDGYIDNILMHSKKLDGTLFWNEASFKLDKENGYVDCASIDVTLRIEQENNLLKAKNSLIEHKEKFEILSEVTFEGILIHDNGIPVSMNNSFSKMFGYTEEELMDIDLVHHIIKEEYHKIIKDNIRNEYLLPYEVIGIKKDGTEFPIEIEGKTFISENNQHLRVTAIRDITNRKKQTQIIEESRQRYKHLSELSIEGIAIHKEGLVVDVNNGLCRIFERKREEFIGINVLAMLFPKKSLDIIYEKFKSDSAAYELLALKPDGTEFWIELEAKNYFIDNEKYRVTAVRDISERKEKESELLKAKKKVEENEAYFRNIFENSPIGISITSLEGEIKTNKAFSDMLGFSLEELQSIDYKKITHPEDLQISKNVIEELIAGKHSTRQFEKRYIHKNGSYVNTDVRTSIQRDSKGNPLFFITNIINITKRRKAERTLKEKNEELIKAKEKAEESDRLKTAFLTNMSHEIRTPMNGIIGFTELLKEPKLNNEEQQQYIRIIEKSGERMLNTIGDIIDIARIESGEVQLSISEINLNDLIEELLEFFTPLANEKNIQFINSSKVSYQQANINSDKEKLNSILTNLIKNALKYTNEGGIEFGYFINRDAMHPEIKFYLKDTGTGIPKGRQKAIFNRFEQADIEDKQVYEGSGLGLAISKAYVELLGGKIWVESIKDKGSQFYFTIPYLVNKVELAMKKNIHIKTKQPKKKSLKILIVDDEEFIITYLDIVIKEYENELLIAKNGIDAVEICRNNPDIDFVLMDIRIPQIDGYEATRRIREFNKDVFILAQTAFAQMGEREKAIDAGCNEYITKPINKERLLEIISSRL